MFIILAIAAIACGTTFGTTLHSGGIGFLISLSGAFIAWLSSWVLYGFGELIDKVCSIESALKGKTTAEIRKENNNRTEHLADLKAKGYITEEEYQQAVGNKPDF